MKTFLIVVAGVFVALVLFIVVAIIALRFFVMSKLGKLRDALGNFAKQMGMVHVPPFSVSLKPLGDEVWSNPQVEEISATLEERGFTAAGDFRAMQFLGDLKLRLMTNVEQGMQAVVYEHGAAGVWLDIVTRYGDGRVVCDSTCRDPLMDSMPQKTARYHQGAEAAMVIETHLAQRPAGGWRAISAKELPALFELIYREEMEWRGSRGGPTPEEIERICERDGTPATSESVGLIREQWQSSFHEYRIEGLKKALRDSGTVSAGEWEQVSVRMAFVYDGMPISAVGDLLESIRDQFVDLDDGDEDEDEEARSQRATDLAYKIAGQGARRAFAELTREWVGKNGFVLYRTVEDPIPADAYLEPEWNADEGGYLE